MTHKLYLCLLFLFLSQIVLGQDEMHIRGVVIDTNDNNRPLQYSLATAIRIRDSLLLDFRRTDKDGRFEMNLPIDTIQLLFSHPKYGENSYYLFGSAENKEFDINRILLPPKMQEIKEVVIYAYKDPVYFKGDTLVYVADSFATKPNAVVEDLLKKLPGIKVNSDGSIQAQGQDIQQVLVDGDEFFGADPTMATKNLGAKGIETVEIYEKRDENSTDDTETIKVLDLRLKEEAKKGYFGKLAFGSDAQKYYEGEFLANKFNKKQKVSLFVLGANTMKSSLAWGDMYRYGIVSWDQGGGGNRMNFSNDQGDGIPSTFKTGAYYHDQLTKSTEIGVNYTYQNQGLKRQNFNRSQYIFEDTSYVTDVENNSDNLHESHIFNLKLTQKLDSLTTLEIEPQVVFNKSASSEFSRTDFLFEDLKLSRYTDVSNRNQSEGMSLNARIGLNRDFRKKGRQLRSSYRFSQDRNSSEGYLYIEDSSVVLPTFKEVTDQRKESRTLSKSHYGRISYLEPLGKKLKLELSYNLNADSDDQDRLTYNREMGNYNLLDSTLSNDFESSRLQNKVGAQFIYKHKKSRLSIGLNARNVRIDNKNLITGKIINQDISNLLPVAKYIFKISQHNRLTLNYNTSSSQPTVSQLQPVNDNSNPNRILVGNPDLKPNFVHSFSGSYSVYKPLSGTYFWSSFNHSVTQNAFASSVLYDNFGRTYSSTINVDGNSFSSANFGGGFSLFKKFLEVSPDVYMSYSRMYNEINGELNTTINANLGGGLELTVEQDDFEISLGANYDISAAKSSINEQSLPYSSQSFDGSLEWDLPWKIYFETDFEYTLNMQRADGYNVNFFIWNASLSRDFLKGENLILALDVYDILGQNVNADRLVSGNIITDTRSTIITRYFLGRITYKFNSTKKVGGNEYF
ncbi:MAG: hypothetical protein EP338_10545 [Bacteroidetes bacterium]|nr:MAG: hypothetical protein EP338_10545 [Bacteroidota bacterium]